MNITKQTAELISELRQSHIQTGTFSLLEKLIRHSIELSRDRLENAQGDDILIEQGKLKAFRYLLKIGS